jgi:hypothetical protein
MNKIVLSIDEYDGLNTNEINSYDYMEIGTCDWDVLSMTKPKLKGFIIEPIKMYLHNIPNNPNAIKINCAISDENKEDYMHYIPPNVIQENKIVDCFRGMNKLGEYHMGAVSNNLTNFVVKEKCEVLTYFTLLNKYNIKYIDLLKIDTEGHDCKIINNILDNLKNNPDYILPRYIYFENNGLTPLQLRTETIQRLYTYGYVHIFTKDDNTFMYNCTTFLLKQLEYNNIKLPRENELINTNLIHFMQDAHSYIEYGQKDLFKNILNLNVTNNVNETNIIWTTQDINNHEEYLSYNKPMINIIHGGGFIYSELLKKYKDLNILVKSIKDYNYLINKHNIGLFIGKYKCQEKLMIDIFNLRQKTFKNLPNKFLMLNGFLKYNPESVKKSYEILKKKYEIHLYGYDSELGWANIINNYDLNNNVLSKYKFMLHLKGNGYLCNSVIFSMMVGLPIIMSKDVYYQTLYCQFIPRDLIILFDNENILSVTPNEIIPSLEYALNMSDDNYYILSKKIFIHGTFFREYYNFELEHLYSFMNNLIK